MKYDFYNLLATDSNMLEKLQDQQFEDFQKTLQMIKDKDFSHAIPILERIMFEDGLLVRGSKWPFVLSDAYLKDKQYNKCWKYTNFLLNQKIGQEQKIRLIQSKIRLHEKAFKDALFYKMLAMINKYPDNFRYDSNSLKKDFGSIIKKLDIEDKEDNIITLLNKHISSGENGLDMFSIEFDLLFK